MRKPAYFTWNTTAVAVSFCHEPSRRTFNRHPTDYVLLRYVSSNPGVFPSDLLPQHPIARSGTLIVKTDPHTVSGSHWLAIHLQSRSHSSYYFDSYGLTTIIPSILSFIRRNGTVWDYNIIQLQGPTSTVCGKYCCLFALYIPKQFVGILTTPTAGKLVSDMLQTEFGPLRDTSLGGQCCGSRVTT